MSEEMSVYKQRCGNCSKCRTITTCHTGYCEKNPKKEISLFFDWCSEWEPVNVHIMEYRKFAWLKIIDGLNDEVKNRA